MGASPETLARYRENRKQAQTIKQKRFLEELPKNGFKIAPSALKAGYSYNTSYKAQHKVINAKGIKECLADLGINNDSLMVEYKKIVKQDDDLTNKRLAIERSAEFINPDLKAYNNTGTTNNIQIIGSDIASKMLELQAELKRLEALETPAIVTENNN